MTNTLKVLSYLALALVILPPVLYLATYIEKPLLKTLMLSGTALWFATAPFWIGKRNEEEQNA